MSRRVLIVDDQEGFRAVARELLSSWGFDVVGEAADGLSAVDEAVRLHPDVVLLDVRLPRRDGFAVAKVLADRTPEAAVVLVSSHDAADLAPLVARSPARGFLTKDRLSSDGLERILTA